MASTSALVKEEGEAITSPDSDMEYLVNENTGVKHILYKDWRVNLCFVKVSHCLTEQAFYTHFIHIPCGVCPTINPMTCPICLKETPKELIITAKLMMSNL
jgi:hypothetical protein